jgi:hypothetical protein
MSLQFSIKIYCDEDYRENTLKSSGKLSFMKKILEEVNIKKKLNAQNIIDSA